MTALGQSVEGIDDFAQIKMLESLTNAKVPRNLAELSRAKVLHEDICNKEEMAERVLKFAAE